LGTIGHWTNTDLLYWYILTSCHAAFNRCSMGSVNHSLMSESTSMRSWTCCNHTKVTEPTGNDTTLKIRIVTQETLWIKEMDTTMWWCWFGDQAWQAAFTITRTLIVLWKCCPIRYWKRSTNGRKRKRKAQRCTSVGRLFTPKMGSRTSMIQLVCIEWRTLRIPMSLSHCTCTFLASRNVRYSMKEQPRKRSHDSHSTRNSAHELHRFRVQRNHPAVRAWMDDHLLVNKHSTKLRPTSNSPFLVIYWLVGYCHCSLVWYIIWSAMSWWSGSCEIRIICTVRVVNVSIISDAAVWQLFWLLPGYLMILHNWKTCLP